MVAEVPGLVRLRPHFASLVVLGEECVWMKFCSLTRGGSSDSFPFHFASALGFRAPVVRETSIAGGSSSSSLSPGGGPMALRSMS